LKSSVRLATSLCLQIVAPEFLSSPDVPALRRVRASEQQEDGFSVLAKVDPIAGPKRQPRLPDAGADDLVIAKVAQLEPEHTRLNLRPYRHIESAEPTFAADL